MLFAKRKNTNGFNWRWRPVKQVGVATSEPVTDTEQYIPVNDLNVQNRRIVVYSDSEQLNTENWYDLETDVEFQELP